MELKLKFVTLGLLILETLAVFNYDDYYGNRERKAIGVTSGTRNTWQTPPVPPRGNGPTTKRPSSSSPDSSLSNQQLKSLFLEWTQNVEREFLPKFLQLVERNGLKIGDCPETTLGLEALLNKIKVHLVQLQTEDRTSDRDDVVYYEEYLKSLVGLRQRLEFLGKESRSEGDHSCTRSFREKHENVTHEVQAAEELVKERVKGFLLDSTIRNIQRRQLGAALSPLMTLESHDLNVLLGGLVESLLPVQDAFPVPNFDAILWFIESVGSQHPSLTEMLSRLVLDKLRAFKLMSSQYIIHLAYIVRATQASEDLQERFPLQIKALLWGRTNCIQHVRTGHFLVEEPFNPDTPAENLLVETRALEHNYGPVGVRSCGWEILPTPYKNAAGYIRSIMFLIRREFKPETIWNLGVANRTNLITLSPSNQNGKFIWEILPVEKTPNNFVFKIRNAFTTPQNPNYPRANQGMVDNNFLCHESTANREERLGTRLSNFQNGSCEWTMENTT